MAEDSEIRDGNDDEVQDTVEDGTALARRVVPRAVEDEIKESYINYAMSVIVGRAIPDARDGLKPVHRRILYGMQELGLHYNKPYRKSARIVGDVLGKYHPHGDSAVYDALVRMAQDFSLRYPLVDGQGNFGSVDGDSAAAMRYTEARLSRIAETMLEDLDKDTVDFQDNFDATLKEPVVLPSKFPNLLVNGTNGIAVGMATNMAPHNLNEICDAVIHVVDHPEAEVDELLEIVKGPDFPTGGIVIGRGGIVSAYRTGRGSFRIRARVDIEEKKNRKRLIVRDIPYQVNKSHMLETMAELVKNKVIEGISDIRDESDRNGIRVVIELKREAMPDIVLNNLYKHTQLEVSFGIINLALVDQRPRILNLKELIDVFIKHRFEVLTRKFQFELTKAEKRAHILEGLIIAVDNIDEVIKIIRGSDSVENAKNALIARFELSEEQAKAILDMRLQKLTGLEIDALKAEYDEIIKRIADLKDILARPERRYAIIKEEMEELKKTFGDKRRTEISMEDLSDLDIEDLIPDEDVVITITSRGYIKRTPLDEYRSQHRGGKGLKGMDTKEEDYVVDLFVCRTHSWIMFFTSRGRAYWLKAYKVPAGGRHSVGRPIVNMLPRLEKDEKIAAVLPIKEFDDSHYLFFATRNGLVKKTVLSAYSRPTVAGINAIKLREGDELVAVALTDGEREIILASKYGQANRFDESEVRPMGRVASGVTGMRFRHPNDEIVSMAVVTEDELLLTITENGYGKRSPVDDYRKTHRGSSGVITIKTNFRNGPVVAVLSVKDTDDIILTTREGMIMRAHAADISIHGRNTMGVRIMKLNKGDVVQSVARLAREDTDDEANEGGDDGGEHRDKSE